MSFICDVCHKASGPGVQPNRQTVETRERIYTTRRGRGKDRKEVEIGRGSEIVREEIWCPACTDLNEEDDA